MYLHTKCLKCVSTVHRNVLMHLGTPALMPIIPLSIKQYIQSLGRYIYRKQRTVFPNIT